MLVRDGHVHSETAASTRDSVFNLLPAAQRTELPIRT